MVGVGVYVPSCMYASAPIIFTTMKDSDLSRHSTHSIIGGEERIRCDAAIRQYKVIRVYAGL